MFNLEMTCFYMILLTPMFVRFVWPGLFNKPFGRNHTERVEATPAFHVPRCHRCHRWVTAPPKRLDSEAWKSVDLAGVTKFGPFGRVRSTGSTRPTGVGERDGRHGFGE